MTPAAPGHHAPLVSIVVCNFNYARYLPRSVGSALAQSHPRVEVVVVDDGSTDGSADLLRGYGDRIRCVFKANGGQASAVNAGFAACSGDLVLFLDADDYLAPDACARVAAAWAPGVAKVEFGLEVVSGDERPLGLRLPPVAADGPEARDLLLRFGYNASPPCSGNVYARAVLRRILPLPEPEWRSHTDSALYDLALFHGAVVHLPELLGCYRIHGGNISDSGEVSVAKLRRDNAVDDRREQAIRRIAAERGLRVGRDLFLRNPSYCKKRLLSWRLDPAGHPHPADRTMRLAIAGAKAALRFPGNGIGKRLVSAVGFLAIGIAPRRLLQLHLGRLLNPIQRRGRPQRSSTRLGVADCR